MPAVEPSLADSKPEEATEAVEVPWTRGRLMRKATDNLETLYKDSITRKRENFFCVSDVSDK